MSTSRAKKSEKPAQTLFGHALAELLEDLRSHGQFVARSNKELIESKLNPKLGPDEIKYQHVNMMISGERKAPKPSTIIQLVRQLGTAADWSVDRIQRETIKLLLNAGYGDLPGLIPRRIDVAYQKLTSLMEADSPAEVDETDRLKIGVIEYEPFVLKGGDQGFAIDIAKLLIGSLLRGRNLGYVSWDTPLKYDNMIQALEEHRVDLVVSGIVETIPRSVRASFIALPALRMYLDAIARPGFEDPETWTSSDVRIACRIGEIGHEYAESFLQAATILPKPADWPTEKVLSAVVEKKADVAIADSATCATFHQNHPDVVRLSAINGQGHYLQGFRIGFLVRRDDHRWAKVLRESIDLLSIGREPLVSYYRPTTARPWVERLNEFLVKDPAQAVSDSERVFVTNLIKKLADTNSSSTGPKRKTR